CWLVCKSAEAAYAAIRSLELVEVETMRQVSASVVGRVFALMLAALAQVILILLTPPGFAAAQQRRSTVEKLYAELAALPASERAPRLEDGAPPGGKPVLLPTVRGTLGARHFALFPKRHPLLPPHRAGRTSRRVW